MKKLLTLIAAMIICNAYGGTAVYWMTPDSNIPNAITTCTSGGNVAKPTTDPTKSGYRFIGWKIDTNNTLVIVSHGGYSFSPSAGTNSRVWTMTNKDHNITITGEARCSSTTGTLTTTTACGTKNSNPATTANVNGSTLSNEQYCWCRITNYAGIAVPNMDWVYRGNYNCQTYCAYSCGQGMRNTDSGSNGQTYQKFRRCILGLD